MIKHVSLAVHVDLYRTPSGSWKAKEVESGVTSSAWFDPELAVKELLCAVRDRVVIQDPPQQQRKRG